MEWSPLYSGLVGAIVATALGYWTITYQEKVERDANGWMALRPTATVHFAFIGSFAFSALMLWLYLFVGSARTDADTQEFMMLVLFAVFGVAAMWTFWSAYLYKVRWKGSKIEFGRLGRIHRYKVQQIAAKKYVAWRSEYAIEFEDGQRLFFSPYMRGGLELARKLGLEEP